MTIKAPLPDAELLSTQAEAEIIALQRENLRINSLAGVIALGVFALALMAFL